MANALSLPTATHAASGVAEQRSFCPITITSGAFPLTMTSGCLKSSAWRVFNQA